MEQRYIFSGHESFPCKSLWLKKGYDFVVQEISLVLKTMPIRLTWSLTGGPTSGRRLMSCLKKTKGVQKNWKNKSTLSFLATPM